MGSTKIDPEQFLIKEPTVVVREVGDEAFLVHAEAILHLNPLAAALWKLLDQPCSIRQAVDLLHTVYPEASRQQLDKDVELLFAQMLGKNLLQTVDLGEQF